MSSSPAYRSRRLFLSTKTMWSLLVAFLSTNVIMVVHAAWVPVAYDMVASTSLNLLSHTNPWVGAFSSSHDGFEIYARGTSSSIPKCMLDDSTTTTDTLGIIAASDTDEFFGFADTENNQNAGPVTASWDFDITGYSVVAISIDAAAMGDFEESGSSPDWFKWRASVDGGPQTIILEGVADASLTVAYTMEDGSLVDLQDPMMVNGKALTNSFQTIVSSYVPAGGSTLTLELEAFAAGSNEATVFRDIIILADDGSPTAAPTTEETCPEEYCAGVTTTTMPPTTENCPGNVAIVTLASTVYNDGNGDEVHVELLGPANPAKAAAFVLTSPHGGYLQPSYIPERTTNDPTYCPPSGCTTIRDSYTKELTLSIQQEVMNNYCKVPYAVINHLHRNRLDANREIGEAAFGDPIAETAWWAFHTYIADAQQLVKDTFGTVVGSTGLTGIVGLLLDVHGYAGKDWVANDGAPFVQWGYNLNAHVLAQCPADVFSGIYPDDDTFSHASTLPNQSLECLVRGPASLGSRLVPPEGGVDDMCGTGLPSYEFPDPDALANDCAYCNDMCGNNPDPCYFYRGGYDIRTHEYLDWQNGAGDLFNTVQAEFPRCIRFNSTMRALVADSLSTAACSFMNDLYGENAETCG